MVQSTRRREHTDLGTVHVFKKQLHLVPLKWSLERKLDPSEGQSSNDLLRKHCRLEDRVCPGHRCVFPIYQISDRAKVQDVVRIDRLVTAYDGLNVLVNYPC